MKEEDDQYRRSARCGNNERRAKELMSTMFSKSQACKILVGAFRDLKQRDCQSPDSELCKSQVFRPSHPFECCFHIPSLR